ncbi:MAG: hypothetical protein B9J98_06610 [Candidatus Terraquivivens tikiterensis]|uniref:Cas12f1-like TNB domain-containing protein n=1 Tax=Candidatus Terraquivivens tikiterensis TaxID=1980982 RepID=A0A2R7Y1B4_9ARCH|nr:MAG: hypothetical protein B9J98_06610 [Candidatus Terraquivivens tikiterensis]
MEAPEFVRRVAHKSSIQNPQPYNTTKRCSRCGMTNSPKGAIYERRHCGFRIDRQLSASINLYLKMEGLTPSLKNLSMSL